MISCPLRPHPPVKAKHMQDTFLKCRNKMSDRKLIAHLGHHFLHLLFGLWKELEKVTSAMGETEGRFETDPHQPRSHLFTYVHTCSHLFKPQRTHCNAKLSVICG